MSTISSRFSASAGPSDPFPCLFSQQGASAPAKAVYKSAHISPSVKSVPLLTRCRSAEFGITGEDVAARSQKAIAHFKKLGHPVYSPVSHSFAI